jgi:hypothetical protein
MRTGVISAGLRRRDAARGTGQQAHAQALFQAAHRVAQRRLRHAQPFSPLG